MKGKKYKGLTEKQWRTLLHPGMRTGKFHPQDYKEKATCGQLTKKGLIEFREWRDGNNYKRDGYALTVAGLNMVLAELIPGK